jgi:DNA-binding transcriptional regulator YiaG
MPDLAAALKAEIQRLARKEVKAQTAVTRKASSQHRRDIAELKRQVKDLTRELSVLRKQEERRSDRPAAALKTGAAIRFSPAWVKRHRTKLGLSAADYAALVGVSSLTIYNWESGKTRPQQKQLAAWGAMKSLGKREAWKRLEAMER